MITHSESLHCDTRGRGAYEITNDVMRAVAASNISHGLCNVFIHHTSASLLIGENADPDVVVDLESFLARLVPDGDPIFVHTAEGPDDMPAHIRSALTQTALSIPIQSGRCDLGTWQGVFVLEHRLRAHTRRVTVTSIGSA